MSTANAAAAASRASRVDVPACERRSGPRPSASETPANAKTPVPVSCQLTGKKTIGASTKKSPPVWWRIAFQPIALSAPARAVASTVAVGAWATKGRNNRYEDKGQARAIEDRPPGDHGSRLFGRRSESE